MPPSADRERAAAGDGVDVAIAIIARSGRVLICQRPQGGTYGGYWEFPGGKREAGESIRDCLRREVREELALDVEPVAELSQVEHDYPRGRIRLYPYVCTFESGEPQLLACQAAKWITPQELTTYRFPPANDSLIAEAITYLTRPTAAPGTGPLISSLQPPRLYPSGD